MVPPKQRQISYSYRCFCHDMHLCRYIHELILDFGAVTTIIRIAPGQHPITSAAPHGKSSSCCGHLCLLHNGCQVISLLQPCSLQGLVQISQDMPLYSDKRQEALFKRRLGQTLQVPNFGGLCDGQAFPLSTRQSYVDLKHTSKSYDVYVRAPSSGSRTSRAKIPPAWSETINFKKFPRKKGNDYDIPFYR